MQETSILTTHPARHGQLMLKVRCEAHNYGALLEVDVPRSHKHHGVIIVERGNCKRLLKERLGSDPPGGALHHGDAGPLTEGKQTANKL